MERHYVNSDRGIDGYNIPTFTQTWSLTTFIKSLIQI